MSQKIQSYEGNEPYIFISYAHRDSARVLPVLERLSQQGYRIWYDDGIEPGTQWSENIAEHLSRAEVVLAFGSANYVSSKNCRQEIEFSISEEKNLLVIWLEATELSSGLKMRLSMIQSIKKYQMSEADFERKMLQATSMARCKAPGDEPERVVQQAGVPGGELANGAQPSGVPGGELANGVRPSGVPGGESGRTVQQAAVQESVPRKAAAQKRKAAGKKRSVLVPILIGAVIGIIIIVGAIFLFRGKDQGSSGGGSAENDSVEVLEIGGKTYKLDDTAVVIRDRELSTTDLENIGRLKKLRSLSLQNCGLKDLAPLHIADLTELYVLELTDNPEIDDQDLKELSGHKDKLGTLILARTGVTTLESLMPLGKIRKLSLEGCKGFKDVDQLVKLTTLEELYISNTGVTSLEKLQNLTNLKTVAAAGDQLTSLKGLENSLLLETLYAEDNRLTTTEGLENATQLKRVNLSGNKIGDVSVLEKSIDQLKYLNLSGNPVGDAEFLLKGEKLEAVFLDQTGITSLKPYQKLPELRVLSARNNGIAEKNVVLFFTKLDFLDASGNQMKGSLNITTNNSKCDILLMDNQLDHFYLEDYADEVFLSGNPVAGIGKPGASLYRVYLGYHENMDFSVGGDCYISYEDVPLDLRVNMQKENSRITFAERQENDAEAEKLRQTRYSTYFEITY